MNRNAIALAADSAVTVGNHVAIHNSANKLFSLSRIAPVGVLVYSNASLMNVPVEIIVKEYKKQLQNRTFPKLKDYVDDFLKYLESNIDYFHFAINEENYIKQVFYNLMLGMLEDYKQNIEKAQMDSVLTDELRKQLTEKTIEQTMIFIASHDKRTNYKFSEYIRNKYYAKLIELIGKDGNFKWLDKEQIASVCDKACNIFDSDFERNGFVGIAIAGYGEDEIYPSSL